VRHVAAIVIGILLLAASLGLLVVNAHGIPLSILIAVGVGVTLACALLIPAQFREALVIVVPLLPDFLVNGRRKTDPQVPPTPPPGGAP
jgi:hypothetical protein